MGEVLNSPSQRTWKVVASAVAALALAAPTGAQGTFPLRFLPSGGMVKAGGEPTQILTLSPNKPTGVTKLPDHLTGPLFGVFPFGPTAKQVTVLLDAPAGGTPRLFVDGNADGDLTDDDTPSWSPTRYRDDTGTTRTRYAGQATVLMPSPAGNVAVPVTMDFMLSDADDPTSEMPKGTMGYYPDYLLEGRVRLDGKTYPILLNDSNATGDSTVLKNLSLLIDVNRDGRFRGTSESYEADAPFNIDGTTYKISMLSPDGHSMTIVKSPKIVAEIPPDPNLNAGRKALPFTVKTTDGHIFDLGTSYRGKLVLLDFWATWCGPCRLEQPNITQAYRQFHDNGLEVLGISLDMKDAATTLANYTKQHGMQWPQVYDGSGFRNQMASLYGASGIPTSLLVDGDTGRIVADSDSLRGDRLLPTLSAALSRKNQRVTVTSTLSTTTTPQ